MRHEEMVRRAVLEIQCRLDDSPDSRALAASAFVSPWAICPGCRRHGARLYREYLPDVEYQLRDEITFEVYVSTHDDAAPEKMQTDLYAPIV